MYIFENKSFHEIGATDSARSRSVQFSYKRGVGGGGVFIQSTRWPWRRKEVVQGVDVGIGGETNGRRGELKGASLSLVCLLLPAPPPSGESGTSSGHTLETRLEKPNMYSTPNMYSKELQKAHIYTYCWLDWLRGAPPDSSPSRSEMR
jgi:hypothetical protein